MADNLGATLNAFDHIILLLSFVYALAIAHLLSTTAMLIRRSETVRFSWLHASWMIFAVLIIVANWISFFDMHALRSWSVATIFFTFAMAFANYLQAALVCPEVEGGGHIDLVAFQARQRRRIVGSWLVSVVFALVANAVYGLEFGMVTWDAQNWAVVPMGVAGVVALIWPARWAQIFAVVVVTVAWIVYFIGLQPALS